VSFAAITLCVTSQQVFVVVYLVIDLVQKLLDTPSYMHMCVHVHVQDLFSLFLYYESYFKLKECSWGRGEEDA